MAPEKPKLVKKAVESLKPSPMATRNQMNNANKDTLNTNDNMLQSIKDIFLPRFDQISSDIHAVQSQFHERFQDVENTVDQIQTAIDTLKADAISQQNAMQQQLEAVIARVQQLEFVQQPTAQDSQPPITRSPLGTQASKYAASATSDTYLSKLLAPPPAQPIKRPYKGGLRLFTAISSNQGFEHIYVPIRSRVPYKKVRSELRNAGINSGSIVDIHYPNNKVLALLVHNDYIDTCRSLLLAEGLTCIENFNPYDPKHLADPQFKEATDEERTKQLAIIRENQVHKTLTYLRNPVKLAVARDFHRKGLISTEFLDDLVKLHPNHEPTKAAQQQHHDDSSTQPRSTSLASFLQPSNMTQDDLMFDEDEDEYMSNNDSFGPEESPTALNSSAGGGEPASCQ
jgi:hypothetical protein